jgi:hydrogenase maturation protease
VSTPVSAVLPVLVVGVGNDLRRDDGVGREVVEAVARALPRTVDALVTHQLLPEILEQFTDRRTVIVVDAAVPHRSGGPVRVNRVHRGGVCSEGGPVPGNVPVRGVCPDVRGSGRGSAHAMDLRGVLTLAGVAGIPCPQCWSVTVTAYDLGLGEGLSPGTRVLVERTVRLVVALAGRGWNDPQEA